MSDKNNNEEIEVNLEDIPPITAPILSLLFIYFAFTISNLDWEINLALGVVGAILFGLYSFKVVNLYEQEGIDKVIDYSITPPAEREQDYSIDLKPSSGVQKTEKGITLDHLREIDPYEFEEFVAKVWRNMGYEAKVTEGSQDKGIDVIAEKSEPYNKKVLIQAKRKSKGNKVGGPTVRRCSGLKNKTEVDEVVIVTSGEFTSQAKEEAEEFNLKTINGTKLLELYEKYVE